MVRLPLLLACTALAYFLWPGLWCAQAGGSPFCGPPKMPCNPPIQGYHQQKSRPPHLKGNKQKTSHNGGCSYQNLKLVRYRLLARTVTHLFTLRPLCLIAVQEKPKANNEARFGACHILRRARSQERNGSIVSNRGPGMTPLVHLPGDNFVSRLLGLRWSVQAVGRIGFLESQPGPELVSVSKSATAGGLFFRVGKC